MFRTCARRVSFYRCNLEPGFASCYSTSPQIQDTSKATFKTPEANLNNLSSQHLGRFYSIDKETFKKVFDHSRHHGFPLMYRELCKTFREHCILVRKPFLDLKSCVEAVDLTKPVVRFLLYGRPGSGKSMTLGSMAQYGSANDFIVVHFPYLPLWSKYCLEIVASTTRKGCFDHTLDTVSWLTKFKIMNADLIGKSHLETEKEYQWSRREITPSGSSLLEIVDHGIARPAHATECMAALFQELKSLSSKQKCKTMVLADGANDLFYQCPWIENPAVRKQIVPNANLTALTTIKNIFLADWSGGVVIAIVDRIATNDQPRDSDLPRNLLGKEGWEVFDPFVPIYVPDYTSSEVQTTIDYFLERKWLGHPSAGSEEARLELEYLSTRNPYELNILCSSR